MLEFVNPWAFALLLAPLLVSKFSPPHKESQASLQVPFFNLLIDLSGETPLKGATILHRQRIQRIMIWLAWLCLVLGAAKPEWVGEPVQINQSARDLMIAVDLSGSMEKRDFSTIDGQQINRLQAVKVVLEEFAQRRQGDRLGLIVFGDGAYLQAPFTTDKATWLTLLRETQIGMAGASTAIGDAIGLAISHFEASDTDNRVLILLTDGNDTVSKLPPIDAARVAHAYRVKIYTIAIGDPQTQGEEAMDVDSLQRVATLSQGAYFEAISREQLEQAYSAIEALEPELYQSLSYRPRSSLFHYPLAVMAVMYLLVLPLLVLANAIKRRRPARV